MQHRFETARSQPEGASPVLDLVGLTPLMARTRGRAEVVVGIVDGPVATDLPMFATSRFVGLTGARDISCGARERAACAHGTFVASLLAAERGADSLGICPACTFAVRAIFHEATGAHGVTPSARAEELAGAIVACVEAGARIVNLSLAVVRPSARGERELERALAECMQRGVIVVAATGNQSEVGSVVVARHPWVLPVAACDASGRVLGTSNLGASIGRRGLLAPGVVTRRAERGGGVVMSSGTSVAAPFVTGALALLWSELPELTAADLRRAVTGRGGRRASVVPPLLDAWAAFGALKRASRATGDRR